MKRETCAGCAALIFSVAGTPACAHATCKFPLAPAWCPLNSGEKPEMEPVKLDWHAVTNEQPPRAGVYIARLRTGKTIPVGFEKSDNELGGEFFDWEGSPMLYVTHWAPFPVVPQPETQDQPKTTTLFWNNPATIKPHSGALCLGQCSRGEVHAVKYSDTDDSWYFAHDFDNWDGNPFQVILWAEWPGRVKL